MMRFNGFRSRDHVPWLGWSGTFHPKYLGFEVRIDADEDICLKTAQKPLFGLARSMPLPDVHRRNKPPNDSSTPLEKKTSP